MNAKSRLKKAATDESTAAESLTTHAAAAMLGVSPGTVLNMIERGQLDAWRTAGGHRRIARTTLLAYLARQRAHQSPIPVRRLQVMVIEDESFQRALYQEQISHWQLPVDLALCASGLEGLLEIGRRVPDLLFVDLRMPEIDGFAVVRRLRNDARYASMSIVVITALTSEDIQAEGGLPADVLVWHKPVPFERMRGYVEARLAATPNRIEP